MNGAEVLMIALLAFVVGIGLGWLTKGEYDAAEKWGRELGAMRRTVPPSVDLEDVRIVRRGVPTDDGGDDLL